MKYHLISTVTEHNFRCSSRLYEGSSREFMNKDSVISWVLFQKYKLFSNFSVGRTSYTIDSQFTVIQYILFVLHFCTVQGSHSDWKIGRHFPVREKSGNFEQTGKVRENPTKYWKILGISDKYYFLFLVIFK